MRHIVPEIIVSVGDFFGKQQDADCLLDLPSVIVHAHEALRALKGDIMLSIHHNVVKAHESSDLTGEDK